MLKMIHVLSDFISCQHNSSNVNKFNSTDSQVNFGRAFSVKDG